YCSTEASNRMFILNKGLKYRNIFLYIIITIIAMYNNVLPKCTKTLNFICFSFFNSSHFYFTQLLVDMFFVIVFLKAFFFWISGLLVVVLRLYILLNWVTILTFVNIYPMY
ncbi:hypothetical protein L9F63_017903, partial [Diploptera punctata]